VQQSAKFIAKQSQHLLQNKPQRKPEC